MMVYCRACRLFSAVTKFGLLAFMAQTTFVFSVAASTERTRELFDFLHDQHVVTTGQRRAIKMSEAPSSVWVIDRATIERSAALTIPDLLRRIPGVSIAEFSPAQSEVSIRGYSVSAQNRVLFLVDGRAVLRDFLGDTDLHGLSLAINDIERIEVVLGSASTLYGTGAFSGVVNIITRTHAKDGLETEVDIRGGIGQAGIGPAAIDPALDGLSGLVSGFAGASQAIGRFGYRVSLSGESLPTASADGYAENDPTRPQAQRKIGGNLDLYYEGEDWSVRTQLSTAQREGDFFTFFRAGLKASDHSGQVTYSHRRLLSDDDNFTLTMWGRRLSAEYDFLFPGLPAVPIDIVQTSGEVLGLYELPEIWNNRLIAGVQMRITNTDLDLVRAEGRMQNLWSAFLENQFRPWEPLMLTTGVRVETREAQAFDTLSRLTVNPRLALVYLPRPEHSVRVEYATAFRNPNALENFSYATVYDGALELFVGNEGLLPERNETIALSYIGHLGRIQPRVEVFVGRTSNAIESIPRDEGGFLPQTFFNRPESAGYYGAVAHLEAAITASARIYANYSWYRRHFASWDELISGDVSFRDEGIVDPNNPQHQASVGGWYHWRSLLVAVDVFYRSSTRHLLDPFDEVRFTNASRVIVNPRVAYTLRVPFPLEISLAGTNIAAARLGGETRRDVSQSDVIRVGPRFWLGLRANWDAETK